MSLLLLVIAGCTNSGLDRGLTATGDTGDIEGGNKENCPFVGEWELETIQCSTFDYTDWYEAFEAATMEIDHDPDGGCKVVATLKSADCKQEEEWHFSKPAGTEVEVTYEGISDCRPNECSFDVIGSCETGRNQGQDTAAVEEGADELTFTNLLANTAANCPLTVKTVWKKK